MQLSHHAQRARWCAKPKIQRIALDIGGACRVSPADGRGGLWEAGEGLHEGLGGMEPEIHKGGAANSCKSANNIYFAIDIANTPVLPSTSIDNFDLY